MSFTPHVPSLLLVAFTRAGRVINDFGGGFITVLCPWTSHGDSTHTAFLTLTVAPPNVGKFFCKTCGHRSPEEVLAALPPDAVVRACEVHECGTQLEPLDDAVEGE